MSGEVAKHLSNYGHEKFVENAHGHSVWTVLPINHILGKLLLTSYPRQFEAVEMYQGQQHFACLVEPPNDEQLGAGQRLQTSSLV